MIEFKVTTRWRSLNGAPAAPASTEEQWAMEHVGGEVQEAINRLGKNLSHSAPHVSATDRAGIIAIETAIDNAKRGATGALAALLDSITNIQAESAKDATKMAIEVWVTITLNK